jgi:Cyclic nucleotide-binding domain
VQIPRIATHSQEKEAIYRLRYAVFAENLGRTDLEGLDHDRKFLLDPLDDVSKHYYLGDLNKPLAAITVSPLSEDLTPSALYEFLGIRRLSEAVPIERMRFANWLVVTPEFAGTTVVTKLIGACYEGTLSEGVDLLLTYCRPGQVGFNERIGFEQYSHSTHLEGFGLRCPLMLLVRDGAMLRSCRSPLYRIYKAHAPVGSPDETRLRLEPIVDMFQASQILVNDDLWMDGAISPDNQKIPLLFAGISEEYIRQVLALTSVISVKSGEVITRRGETSDDMFVVVSGSFLAKDLGTGVSRSLGQGDIFGELEHLSGTSRHEEVVALTSGHVAALKSWRLFDWMRRNPEPGVALSINLARLLSSRIVSYGNRQHAVLQA